MILTELSTLDVKIEEEDKMLHLLASLHASYDQIVATLLFGKDTLKHDEVIVALLLNESRQKSCNDSLSGSGIPNPRITNHLYVGIVVRKTNCPEREDSEEKR